MRSPLEQQINPRPAPLRIPPVGGNLPGPNTRPTPEQTQAYINSNANPRTLDASLKQALVYNQSNAWFNSSTLPNGQANSLYQNGRLTPNWYLPTTWPATGTNWQGVQPSGFLPSASATTHSLASRHRYITQREEGEMLVHLALARICGQTLGNVQSAKIHLKAALALAEVLGDHYTKTEVGKRLAELKVAGT